jgi:hypothetical protein
MQRMKLRFADAGPNLLKRSRACIAQIISLPSLRLFLQLAGQFDLDRIFAIHHSISRSEPRSSATWRS